MQVQRIIGQIVTAHPFFIFVILTLLSSYLVSIVIYGINRAYEGKCIVNLYLIINLDCSAGHNLLITENINKYLDSFQIDVNEYLKQINKNLSILSSRIEILENLNMKNKQIKMQTGHVWKKLF